MPDDIQPAPQQDDGVQLATPSMVGQTLLSEKFLSAYADRFLYVPGVGWHHWSGTHWAPDESDAQAHRALRKTLRTLWVMAMNDRQKQSDLRPCMSHHGQVGALAIASTSEEVFTSAANLDADPYLLNLANGTFDLRTFTLRAHDRADRLTKKARGAYDKNADQTFWNAFLNRILPDQEVREYVQRIAGLALLGCIVERIFPIATGKGGNGKTKFYEAFLNALGDYGHTAESDLFIQTKTDRDRPSPSLFNLRGKRFIVCSETNANAPLAQALVKNLTGDDPITVRALRKMPITFVPSFTPWLVTNFLPKVTSHDDALWDRVSVIPFDVEIPPNERDGHLGETLKLHADAIITWAIDGYQDYATNGLNPPNKVKLATQTYRANSDAFGMFMLDMLDTSDPDARTPRTRIWQEWQHWAMQANESPGLPRDFYRQLEQHFKPVSVKGTRTFEGVRINTEDEDDKILELNNTEEEAT